MSRTREGADRIARQALTATATGAERAMRAHVKGCVACRRAGSDARARCLTWWRLARTARKARRSLRRWAQPDTTGMAPLFTDADLDIPPF